MEDLGIRKSHEQTTAVRFYKEKKYWLNKLSGELIKSSFPYNYNEIPGEGGGEPMQFLEFQLTGETVSKLMKLRNESDQRLHMILVAVLVVLLHRYTTNNDIILGTPALKQDIEAEFINTVLILRQTIETGMTFKELLLQVRQTIIEANKNQNYPVETLPGQLNMSFSNEDDFPLFDVVLLVENIHDKKYIEHLNPNIIFSFLRTRHNQVKGKVEFNASLYNLPGIEGITGHFQRLLGLFSGNVNLRLSEAEMLSEEERRKLLEEFNDTAANHPYHYSLDKTAHQLFDEQVNREPGHTALVDPDGIHTISYGELSRKSGVLARLLKTKGVGADSIVGIMMKRSITLVIGMLGILKSGAAYLPIDANYPKERVRYMLQDSRTSLLLTGKEMGIEFENGFPGEIEIIDPTDEAGCQSRQESPESTTAPGDLLYLIYTSGSTGRPKGVLINHTGFVNMIYFHRKIFGENSRSRMSQVASTGFDAMAFEIWPCLACGATLYFADDDTRIDSFKMKQWLINNRITISYQPTILAEQLLREDWPLEGTALKALRAAGDQLTYYPKSPYPFRFYNLYGPTESTVWTTWAEVETDGIGRVAGIGRPIGKQQVYILASNLQLQPIGIPGELCIGGVGLARGYLNRPELTNDKFLPVFYRSYRSYISKKIYKTGDLAKWLPDGNIQFLGRLDRQLKIRGFRIEPEEIETQLLKHKEIKNAVVLVREDHHGNKNLAAYIVTGKKLTVSEIRQYLSVMLPDYMVPMFFVEMEEIPLTANGKVDRKKLMGMSHLLKLKVEYLPPRDKTEKKLVEIWAKVLQVEKKLIGINDNFFRLGGHSLNATLLTAEIHKELAVNVSLSEVFKNNTVRELTETIKKAANHQFVSIELAEEKEYYPLSSAQQRIYLQEQIEKSNLCYHLFSVVELEGNPDRQKFQQILKQMITRHDSLRTSFEIIYEEPRQRIHDQVAFAIEYYETHQKGAAEILESFRQPFDLSKAPLVRVGLINVKPTRSGHDTPGYHLVLLVDMHHIISDEVSQTILVKEFMALYHEEKLPALKLQYKDYTQWQNRENEKQSIKKQEKYWLDQFEGDIPVLKLPFDYQRPPLQNFKGSTVGFKINQEETKQLKKLESEQITLFMILFAIYNVLLSKICHQEDIIIGVPVAGRRHTDLENIMGMFVNMLALQNFPAGNQTFMEFLREVKERTLMSFENQAYPFDDLVQKISLDRDVNRNPLFDTVFSFHHSASAGGTMEPGPGSGTYKIEKNISHFDLLLHATEMSDWLQLAFEYSTDLFNKKTIEKIIEYYIDIVKQIVKNKNIKLKEITIPHDWVAVKSNFFEDEMEAYDF